MIKKKNACSHLAHPAPPFCTSYEDTARKLQLSRQKDAKRRPRTQSATLTVDCHCVSLKSSSLRCLQSQLSHSFPPDGLVHTITNALQWARSARSFTCIYFFVPAMQILIQVQSRCIWNIDVIIAAHYNHISIPPAATLIPCDVCISVYVHAYVSMYLSQPVVVF